MLRSMLCLGRDENGYPTKGIDAAPERPKPKSKMAQLMTLLQGANQREEKNANRLITGIGRITG